MRFIAILLISFFCLNIEAQSEDLLISVRPITDWSDYPIYPRLIDEGSKQWKSKYQYLDDIEVAGITYMSDGLKVKGLLVRPKADGNYPCIIYNRGGNRDFGALKAYHGAIMLGQLAKEGYVVIASQYRGNGGGEGQEEFGGSEVNDITILPEVLGELSYADTSRIGMYGWSRGGMMSYIALKRMPQLKALAVGGAVSNSHEVIKDRPEMETKVIAELVPNYAANKEAELDKRSAVKWADQFPKHIPILMLHGNADWRVKPEQSLNLALEFEKYRIPYRLIMYEGGDHGLTEHSDEVDQEVLNWFDKYVKMGSELPNMEYHGR